MYKQRLRETLNSLFHFSGGEPAHIIIYFFTFFLAPGPPSNSSFSPIELFSSVVLMTIA